MSFCVYILYCANHNYYTGYTNDLARRYKEHLAGSAKCKYTRSFKPLRIAQSWEVLGDKATAMKMEKFIKSLSRKKKEDLLLNPMALSEFFDCKPLTSSDIQDLSHPQAVSK